MKMLPTVVLIILFISKSCCSLICERNGTAILTDTNQNERNSEKGHDGELAVHLRKTGNYDAAPIFPNIDKMHRVVKRNEIGYYKYIKMVTPKHITALIYTDVTFECKVYTKHVEDDVYVSWYYYNSTSEKKITIDDLEKNGFKKQKKILYDGKPPKLHLFNVTHLDEGWYICVAHVVDTYIDKAYLKVVNEKQPIKWEYIIEIICTVIVILILIFIILYCFIDIKSIYKLIIK